MKKGVLLAAVVIFGAIAPVFAVQEAPDGALHGNVGLTFGTLYIWRGILIYGADTAIHPFIDLDLMGSGFHLEAVGHRANDGGNEEGERWDYSLYYTGVLEPEQTWETCYLVGYRYFNFPELSGHNADSVDLQEVYAGFAFPELLGIQGLVPGYVVLKTWPSNSSSPVGTQPNPSGSPAGGTYAGWQHVFMLDYALKLEGLTAETPSQTLNFHAETVFNDGADPRPFGNYTDSDWTHALFGVSTDFDLGSGVTFTPALYHQITFEDDKETGVSPDHDITYASATLKYKF